MLAVGDSIVNADRSLAYWVSEAMGRTLDRVSVGGSTSGAALEQLDRIEGRYPLAVLTVGTNDVLAHVAADTFAANLAALSDGLSQRADVVVMPTLPLALASFLGSRRVLRERVLVANSVIEAQEAVTVVRGDDLTLAAHLSSDRVHPTVAGHRLLAERVLTALGADPLPSALLTIERTARSTRQVRRLLATKALLQRL